MFHHMVAEITQLQPLAPEDAALFERYITAGASLAALADSLKKDPLAAALAPDSPDSPTAHCPLPTPLSLHSLYLWSTQPHIAPWLDFHQSQVRDFERREMLALLKDFAKTSPNPIERRRAASTILRALTAPRVPVGHVPRASKPSITRHLHSSHRQAWTPVSGAPNNGELHTADDAAEHATPVPDLLPNQPLPPTPHLPTPFATPSPEVSDDSLAQLTLSLLRQPEDKRNHATLRAFCTPKTLFAGMQVPTDPKAFSQRATEFLRHHESPRVDASSFSRIPHSPLPTADCPLLSRFRLTTTQGSGKLRHLALELRRESASHPWLISSIAHDPLAKPP
jgi:hypothetical protein